MLLTETTHVPHGARRWASAVARTAACSTDPRTVPEWARGIGASVGALRSMCYAVDVSPRRSLSLARLLRVVAIGQGHPENPRNLFNIVDPRTLRRLLASGGLTCSPHRFDPPTVAAFLTSQTLVTDVTLLSELHAQFANTKQSSPTGVSTALSSRPR